MISNKGGNLSGKGYETKGEFGPSKSLATQNPKRFRKVVGNPKEVEAGRQAFTQDSASNLAQSFEELGRVHAAKGK